MIGQLICRFAARGANGFDLGLYFHPLQILNIEFSLLNYICILENGHKNVKCHIQCGSNGPVKINFCTCLWSITAALYIVSHTFLYSCVNHVSYICVTCSGGQFMLVNSFEALG